MSMSTRNRGQPIWFRIKMISASRAHRAMRKFGLLKLNSHVCPQVDAKFDDVRAGKLSLAELREWLGQVHTDYVSALDQTQEQLIKMRIRLRHVERERDLANKVIVAAKLDDKIEELLTHEQRAESPGRDSGAIQNR